MLQKFVSSDFVTAVKNISWLNLYLTNDVDDAISIFNSKISTILDEMAPIKRIQVRKKFAPWLSTETKSLMRARDYAQSRAIITKNSEDLTEYKKLRNQVTSRLRIEKHTWKERKLQESAQNPSSLWTNVITWLNWKSTGAPNEILYKGVLERKPLRVAECMNEFFVQKIDTLVQNLSAPSSDPLALLRSRLTAPVTFSLKPVYPDKVEKILKGLKNSKSVGVDFLDISTLKLVHEYIIPAITHIINLSIRQQKFPTEWKHAKVIPLLKKGDVLEPKNYRPVAILPVVSKILERVIFEQIVEHFNAYGLFHPNHHGFRKHHNTCTALIQMYDGWAEAVDRGQFTGVAMLDMSAAFDMVNHSLLLQKMELYGFDRDALQWVSAYLCNRIQSVCIDGILSTPLRIKTGVPQGSILGPLFYIIFTNELPESIYRCDKHGAPESPQSLFSLDCSSCGSICCFADDSTFSLVSSDPEELSNSLSEKFAAISEFLVANKLKLNEQKTQLILMATATKKRLTNPHLELITASGIVKEVSSAKLLGVHIHDDMKWADYIAYNEDSLIKGLNKRLIGLKKVCKYSDFKTRLMIANGIFLSKLIYLMPLWAGAESYLIRMLQIVQNKAARYITKKCPETSCLKLLTECGWLSVAQLATYHSLLVLHKTLVFKEPAYLDRMFDTEFPRNTRQASSGCIRISSSKKANLSLTLSSFKWRTYELYNKLPAELRKETSLKKFKRDLKEWVMKSIDIS